MSATTAVRVPAAPVAWLAGLVMVAAATSLVGLFLAPFAVPAAVYASLRTRSWAVRVPLLLGALALSALVGLWLLDGAGTGSRGVVEG